eukprot:TRINITY_DN2556_c0_g1_i12.p1 TRINITY_DN2556_c0_g1~~TRINITY_DN2556_c0_g1_i12.p1  ORF type:complete len:164 (+),score=2.11 TRINITY_DN2556_c0_g1_i12:146-637(+)
MSWVRTLLRTTRPNTRISTQLLNTSVSPRSSYTSTGNIFAYLQAIRALSTSTCQPSRAVVVSSTACSQGTTQLVPKTTHPYTPHQLYTMSAGVGIDYEEFLNSSQVTVTRLMQREDANLAGNVHGGRILQMMEQAGYIAAARHTKNPMTVTGRQVSYTLILVW